MVLQLIIFISYLCILFFKVCDVHITERSSTIIEAASFGIKSIVTSKYSFERFKRFVDSKKIVYCCEWKEILKCAKGLKRDKDDIKEGKEDDIIKLVKMIEEI